jgi:hypothetical protein
VLKAIRGFYGRMGDDTPKHPVEEEHLRHPLEIPRIRRQIVMSSLEGLATHLGGIKQGRKAIVWVTEAFGEPIDEVRDLYQAANRANVAIYPLDPRGLTTDRAVDRGPTARETLAMIIPAREFMRTLALETGGRPFFTNNIGGAPRSGDPRLARLLPDRLRIAASRRWQVSSRGREGQAIGRRRVRAQRLLGVQAQREQHVAGERSAGRAGRRPGRLRPPGGLAAPERERADRVAPADSAAGGRAGGCGAPARHADDRARPRADGQRSGQPS